MNAIFCASNVATRDDVWKSMKELIGVESDFRDYAKFSYEAGIGCYFILDNTVTPLEMQEGDEIAIELCKRFGVNPYNVRRLKMELDENDIPVFELYVYPIMQQ